MSSPNRELEQVETMYRMAVALRRDADPLLSGQFEGLIGRLSALLAVMGAPIPEDALPAGCSREEG